jgi:hypothetical protein
VIPRSRYGGGFVDKRSKRFYWRRASSVSSRRLRRVLSISSAFKHVVKAKEAPRSTIIHNTSSVYTRTTVLHRGPDAWPTRGVHAATRLRSLKRPRTPAAQAARMWSSKRRYLEPPGGRAGPKAIASSPANARRSRLSAVRTAGSSGCAGECKRRMPWQCAEVGNARPHRWTSARTGSTLQMSQSRGPAAAQRARERRAAA